MEMIFHRRDAEAESFGELLSLLLSVSAVKILWQKRKP